MQLSDRAEFLKVLNGLAAIKGKQLAIEALDLWWASMQAWDIADFKAAASHLVTSCQFMPTPYDFAQLRRAGELTAGEAWSLALSHCTCWRGGKTPGGRVDRAVRAIGGYHTIAMADIETALPHIERRFKEAYEELCDVEETREQLPQITLSGLQERISRTKVDEAVPRLLQVNEKT